MRSVPAKTWEKQTIAEITHNQIIQNQIHLKMEYFSVLNRTKFCPVLSEETWNQGAEQWLCASTIQHHCLNNTGVFWQENTDQFYVTTFTTVRVPGKLKWKQQKLFWQY